MLLMVWKGQPDLLLGVVGGWVPTHVDLLLVGWMVQLAMGVGYWIFPRLPYTLTHRGRYPYALSAVILLNVGVIVYVIATLIAWAWGEVLGLGVQVLAIASYIYHLVPRVRSTIPQQK